MFSVPRKALFAFLVCVLCFFTAGISYATDINWKVIRGPYYRSEVISGQDSIRISVFKPSAIFIDIHPRQEDGLSVYTGNVNVRLLSRQGQLISPTSISSDGKTFYYSSICIELLVPANESYIQSFVNSEIKAVFDSTATGSFCYRVIDGILPPIKQLLKITWYDSYSFLTALSLPSIGSITATHPEDFDPIRGLAGSAPTLKGLETGSLIAVIGANTQPQLKLRINGYDHYGRSSLQWEENILGGESRHAVKYDFRGNVLSETERHSVALGQSHWKRTLNKYDHGKRLLESIVVADGDTLIRLNYAYKPTGELEFVSVGTSGMDDYTLHEYNVRGWQTRKKDGLLDSQLGYEWGGNISEWKWQNGNTNLREEYGYDSLSRLTSVCRYFFPAPSPGLQETFEYDLNGNIKNSLSFPTGNVCITNAYDYSGNRLVKRTSENVYASSPPEVSTNEYDSSGRMVYDGANNLHIRYNHLDLIQEIRSGGNTLAKYSYLADGTKLSTTDADGDGLLYAGTMVFEKVYGDIGLESISWDGGRIAAEQAPGGGTSLVPLLYSTDHLGSVRGVRNGLTGVTESRMRYTPYGEQMTLSGVTPRYRFNGKEYQGAVSSQVPYLDYGARIYNPAIGRWLTMDPLGQDYYSLSPYSFCAGNPVNVIDPHGTKLYFAPGTNDRFKRRFAEAVMIMNSFGTSYNISKIEQSEKTYLIAETTSFHARFSPISEREKIEGIIYWNPNMGVKVGEDIMLSPLTILAHEFSHAADYDADKEAHIKRRNNNDPQYGNEEEKRVITTAEAYAGHAHGEIPANQQGRSHHDEGDPVIIGRNSSTSEIFMYIQKQLWRRKSDSN